MFPDQDLDVIEAIFEQCRQNKQTTAEALFQMANPEAADDSAMAAAEQAAEQQRRQQARQERRSQQQAIDEQNQAAMIAAMAGMDGEGMTEEELKDLAMAQALQQQEIKRAQIHANA